METLLKRLGEIDAALDALLANDQMTDEQRAEHDALQNERKAVEGKIKVERDKLTRAASRQALTLSAQTAQSAALQVEEDARVETERQAALAASREARKITNRLSTPDAPTSAAPALAVPTPATPPPAAGIPAQYRRHAPVLYFRDRPGQLCTKEERAYRFGMFCLARLANDVPHRYRFPQAVEFVERHMADSVRRQMAAIGDHDASGHQYLIPEEFGMDLVDLREMYGVFRRVARVMPMSSDTRVDPRRVGGLTATFYAMNATIAESNKTWDNVRLTAKDLGVISRISNQVRADMVVNWGDDLAFEIAYAFSNKEDACGFIGDGTSTYGHIVGIKKKLQDCDNAGTASAGLVVQATGSTWGALTLADFQKTAGKLPQYARVPGQVAWICNTAFHSEIIEKLVLASGGTLGAEVRAGNPDPVPTFLGYPVWFSQVMPAVTATDDVPVFLGNYKLGSRFGDRQQETISFSEHATVGGENLWERNEMGIRGTERFDINNHDCGTATVVGPIVGLATYH